MSEIHDPLTGPLPAEIPLPNAPLVRVLAQIRFPQIASLGTPEFIGPFQEAVRREYGILEQTFERRFEFGPSGTVEHPAKTNSWRFLDTTRQWCVTLAADFVTLETRAYLSRQDFLDRLGRVLAALDEHVDPATVQRVGVRYVDRVPDVSRDDVVTLLRPDAQGLLGTDLASRASLHVVDNLFDLGDSRSLRARWGMLPPNLTIDPLTVEPIAAPCWVLDLDAYVEGEQPLDVAKISSQAQGLAEDVYRFFRWVVTDEFRRKFGGTP